MAAADSPNGFCFLCHLLSDGKAVMKRATQAKDRQKQHTIQMSPF
jgi:hypothetical protein